MIATLDIIELILSALLTLILFILVIDWIDGEMTSYRIRHYYDDNDKENE